MNSCVACDNQLTADGECPIHGDLTRRMTQDMNTLLEKAPETSAGKTFDVAWPGSHLDRLAWRAMVLAVEAQARSAGFFAALHTGEAGTEKAVNAYEPLLKALREIVADLEAILPYVKGSDVMAYIHGGGMYDGPEGGIPAVIARARAALATVESPEREGGE